MSSAARHRSTFELEHFDLKDYLKDLLVDTPLYQDHYNFNQANEYVRFAVDKELEADLTLERDRFPKFDPRNLATVDVRQLFAQHKNLYQTICKIVARSHVQVESEIRQRRSQPFCNEFRQEARVLQGVFHNIIPLAPILPTSSTMNPSQFCLACIIADVSNVVTGKACIFMNTFKSVMYTSGIQAWALYQPEGLVAIVEHFKVFLTGEVSLENKDGTWAKITYIESGEVKSNPVPITTATRSIIIGHDLEVAPTSDKLVLELNNVYHAHPVAPNDKMTKARTNVPTIRLDFIDNTIIWLSTRDKSATHNSYFQQPKKVQIDEAGFRSRGPMYHLMVTFGRLNNFNALRRLDDRKKNKDYEKILLDYCNLKVGLSDKKPDNHKYEEELPCLVNIEVLTDYVQRLLKQKHLTIEDKLLKDFYSLHGLSTNDLSDEQLHDVYWALNHFMLNTLK